MVKQKASLPQSIQQNLKVLQHLILKIEFGVSNAPFEGDAPDS